MTLPTWMGGWLLLWVSNHIVINYVLQLLLYSVWEWPLDHVVAVCVPCCRSMMRLTCWMLELSSLAGPTWWAVKWNSYTSHVLYFNNYSVHYSCRHICSKFKFKVHCNWPVRYAHNNIIIYKTENTQSKRTHAVEAKESSVTLQLSDRTHGHRQRALKRLLISPWQISTTQ